MDKKVPFNFFDLEKWKNVAIGYCNDPVGVTRHFQFLLKQHNPNWNYIRLLLDHMTETKK